MFRKLFNKISLAFLVLKLIATMKTEEIRSTDYVCAGNYAELSCPNGYVIVVNRVENRYSASQCIDYDTVDLSLNSFESMDNCVGIELNNENYSKACNGIQSCYLLVKKMKNFIGHYGTNCDFTSNLANIFYSCVPNGLNESYKTFDICNAPRLVSGLDNGFIRSPNYPEYYSNNLNCELNIGVPKGRRLIIYLLNLNTEGLGWLSKKPNDYLTIGNSQREFYGHMDMPRIVYNSGDIEEVYLKFVSDLVTSKKLSYPKGFLVFFSLDQTITTTTTTPITTTTTTTTAVPSTTTPTTTTPLVDTTTTTPTPLILITTTASSDDLFRVQKELVFNNTFGQLQALAYRERDPNDQISKIITVLICLIGLLILIIIGLLFLFNKKQKQQNEEDNIYDINDEKSISSSTNGNYNEDYQPGSIISSNVMADKSLDTRDNKKKKSKFECKLKRLYQSLNHTLHLSSQILDNKQNKDKDCASLPPPLPQHLNNSEKLNINKQITKSFNINEFNPNDVDIKFEKDIPIDTLKLFQSNTTSSSSSSSSSSSPTKKNNLQHQMEQEQQRREKNINSSRAENIYVTSPIIETKSDHLNSSTHQSFNDDAAAADQNEQLSTSTTSNEEKKLQIYEVNFDNNFAYITPTAKLNDSGTHSSISNLVVASSGGSLDSKTRTKSIGMTMRTSEGSQSSLQSKLKNLQKNDDAEIYQSINDLDDQEDCDGLIDNDELNENMQKLNDTQTSQKNKNNNLHEIDNASIIYATPTNMRLNSTLSASKSVNVASSISNVNTSPKINNGG